MWYWIFVGLTGVTAVFLAVAYASVKPFEHKDDDGTAYLADVTRRLLIAAATAMVLWFVLAVVLEGQPLAGIWLVALMALVGCSVLMMLLGVVAGCQSLRHSKELYKAPIEDIDV